MIGNMTLVPAAATRSKLIRYLSLQREIISVHIGQCGVQLGNACWELYGVEHGVLPDGYLEPAGPCESGMNAVKTFYHETDNYKYVPRAVLVDFEPTVIGKIIRKRIRVF